jgi:hypothetical protein
MCLIGEAILLSHVKLLSFKLPPLKRMAFLGKREVQGTQKRRPEANESARKLLFETMGELGLNGKRHANRLCFLV